MGVDSKGRILLLAVVAGVTMMACRPMARPSPPPMVPAPAPAPQDQETEQSWTISAADFRDDGIDIWLETTNRSEPYAWDAITADNVDEVRVSIAGNGVPFENTRFAPVFASDIYGAEWKVEAEVRAGEVALVLTAEDQRTFPGVDSVEITNPGSGYAYNTIPTVTFSAPPPGGTRATGTAAGPGGYLSVTVSSAGLGYDGVTPTVTFPGSPYGTTATGTVQKDSSGDRIASVTITNPGSGYVAAGTPIISLPPSGTGHFQATTSATLQTGVTEVTITNPGSGYESPPTVTFSGTGGAAGTAVLGPASGNSQPENLYYARQTLYGKQLLVRIADQ